MVKLQNKVDFYAKTGTDDRFLKVIADFKRFGISIDLIDQKTRQIPFLDQSMHPSALNPVGLTHRDNMYERLNNLTYQHQDCNRYF